MDSFELDKTIKNDTIFIKELELSKLLLCNESEVLWFILVPKIANITEVSDLHSGQQIQLISEIDKVSNFIKENFPCDKLNIANIGNVVSQLHIHIIARQKKDKFWPKPIWGLTNKIPYQKPQIKRIKELFKSL
jgi:diadenosine tetraphosphate (Ap4A) HIT family hydrolase